VGIFFFAIPFPLNIIAAALIGFAASALGIEAFRPGAARGGSAGSDEAPAAIDAAFALDIPEHVRRSTARAITVAAVGGVLWLGPLVALLLIRGPDDVFTTIAAFFSEMAVVTFGGAYAVLAYVAQEAVESYHWLQPGEMLAGLGMAETTPGPLIMVLQFVGFMAAFRHPGSLDPMVAGTLGGLLATWVTFTPCFIWIFVGGPYIEALRGNKALGAALSAITAAVVGVILNLAIWFALHTLFGRVDERNLSGLVLQIPVISTLDLGALVLALAALLALFRFKIGMITTLLGCSAAGVALYFVRGLS
jgi:chromate transporter